MKQRERCSGREFDSPHLHQKYIDDPSYRKQTQKWQYTSDGGD